MVEYANKEYAAGGVYKAYVQARDLKMATFRHRMSAIQKVATGKRLLDVGCACGYLIDVALESGDDAYGIEFSEAAIALASEAARPRIIQGDVNQLDTSHQGIYDVITAFDILEHTQAPNEFLTSLRTLLAPGGLLVIATPDTGHVLRVLMGTHWPNLQPNQHTFLFSRRSIQLALEQAGYQEIHVTGAVKVLTPEYLAEQLRIHTPLITNSYRAISRFLPERLRQLAVGVNISEMMAFARRAD